MSKKRKETPLVIAMAMSEVIKMTKEIHDYLAKQWDSEAAYGVKKIAAKYKVKI